MKTEVRPTRTFGDYYFAMRLVHDEYCRAQLMHARESGIRFFFRELTRRASVLVATADSEVIGTATIVLDSIYGIPSTKIFPIELSMLRQIGRSVAEGTKFACKTCPATETRGMGRMSWASTELLRWIFHGCRYLGVDDWVITIHPRMQEFYEEVLGFELLATPKRCPHVEDRPGVLLRLDISGLLTGRKAARIGAQNLFLSEPIPASEFRNWFYPAPDEIALLLLEDKDAATQSEQQERESLLMEMRGLSPIADIIRAPHFLASQPTQTVSLVKIFRDLYLPETQKRGLHQHQFDPKSFPLRASLAQVSAVLETRLGMRGFTLDCNVEDSVSDELFADPELLAQVITNIIEDAASSIPVRTCLRLDVTAHSLKDSEMILQLKFSHSPPKLSASTQSMIQSMGGSWIHDFVNCPLSLECPVIVTSSVAFVDPRRENTSLIVRRDDRNNCQPLHVLVAEDNLVSQQLLARTISKSGHLVDIVSDGRAAVDAALTTQFDIIFMDIQMPILDGFEATREIRKAEEIRKTYTPIYAVTSFVMRKDRNRCIYAGMDGYVPKPVRLSDIERIIAHIQSLGLNRDETSHTSPSQDEGRANNSIHKS